MTNNTARAAPGLAALSSIISNKIDYLAENKVRCGTIIAYCKTRLFWYDAFMRTRSTSSSSTLTNSTTMHTNPAPSTSNGILIVVRGMIENIAQYAEVSDVALLESIATAANQIAQDLRLEYDAVMSQVEEFEADEFRAHAYASDREDFWIDQERGE